MRRCHPRHALLLAWLVFGTGALVPAQSADPAPSAEPETVLPAPTPAPGVSLIELEKLALQHNPTLAQAAASVASSRGKALQPGLYPNPTIGYDGDQIGASGTVGELQGAYVQQVIVTAGKRRLSRAKYRQEAYEAELMALGQQYRVLNGVRIHFYELLALQRMIDLDRELLANAEESLRTYKEMLNAGQANQADVLLAEVQVNDARIALLTMENRYPALWQHLTAILASPEMPPTPLRGQLEPHGPPLDWDSNLNRLLQESPELLAAQAHVVHDEITVQRERVQPIPNLQLRGASGYNFESNKAVAAGIEIGFNVPVWNRNQGTIRQAQADLVRSQAEVVRVQLSLRQRLAETFNQYRTAWQTAEIYRDAIVPQTTKAYEVQLDMYKKRRIAWPEVVVLQRKALEARSRYTQSLLRLREAEVAIHGLLLVDGLTAPPTPQANEQLEATPQPR